MKAREYAPAQRSDRDDERQFWERWPKSSRYYAPSDREMFEHYIPGWSPHRDLNALCIENAKSNPSWRCPLWFEWDRIRAAWPATVYLPPLETFLVRKQPEEVT